MEKVTKSLTPRVDSYLRRLYEGQKAITRETLAETGLSEQELETQAPVFTPEQEYLLQHMADCVAAARRAEQEGQPEAVMPFLRAFMEGYKEFLQSLRHNAQEGKSDV